MKYIKDILNGIDFKSGAAISGLRVSGVTSDSRSVKKGDMFIAVDGYSIDGHKFIKDAISKGAKVILGEKDFCVPKGVIKILVGDVRRALPVIAMNFYKNPSSKLKVIGITGTNGKTTIAYLIENIVKAAGKEAGVIGTINYRFKNKASAAKNTTPGPLDLQALLAEMVKESVDYAVMEVSSHSLDQHRVDGVFFDAAIFTNITSEHLDYHKNIKNYFNAKVKIFDRLKKDGSAILNCDDDRVASLEKKIKERVITYGFNKKAYVRGECVNYSMDGSAFSLVTPAWRVNINTKLIGAHNVSNILASAAATLAEKIDYRKIKEGIESLESVPGRLERLDAGQPFKVFVDYAHTEDALYNVLNILKKIAKRDIITVFGCGGNRDRQKRPLMGKVACSFSDKVIITSDNPRFENPSDIIDEIEKGVKGKFSNYDIIEDRMNAIENALNSASKDDIVVIAGKGHEKYQIIRDHIVPFDDYKIARSILKKMYKG